MNENKSVVCGAKDDRRSLSSMPEIENILSQGTEDALAVRWAFAKEARSANLLFFQCMKGSDLSPSSAFSLTERYCVTIATIFAAESSSSNSFKMTRRFDVLAQDPRLNCSCKLL